MEARKHQALKDGKLSRKANSDLGNSRYTNIEATKEWKDRAFEEHCEQGINFTFLSFRVICLNTS